MLALNIPNLEENKPLAPYTTMKVGGPARWFVEAKTTEEIIHAVQEAVAKNIPYEILGGGSNVLVADQGFHGLIIRTKNSGYEFKESVLIAEAGATLMTLVMQAVKRGLAGLEWGAGIPGTLGGAVRGNAGSMGSDMAASIQEVEIITRQGKKKTLSKEDCHFSYRMSRMKKNKDTVLRARMQLSFGNTEKLQKTVKEHLSKKNKSQDLKHPSSGCMFTNPLPEHAGKIIDDAGMKGFQIGGAKVSEAHGNFLINTGNATAEDIVMLISAVKQKIRDTHNIELIEEVQYIGF